jgi:hypothetical protein
MNKNGIYFMSEEDKFNVVDAIKLLKEHSKHSISQELAMGILEAFGLDYGFNKKLVHKKTDVRELDYKPGSPRVNVDELTKLICALLHLTPNKKKLDISKELIGAGSSMEERTMAYLIPIAEKFNVKTECEIKGEIRQGKIILGKKVKP